MNNQASSYRIPNVRPRRSKFLPRNLRQGAAYVIPNNGHTLDSSTQWNSGWNFANKIRNTLQGIGKIVNFIHERVREKAAAGGNGCSTPCVAVGAVTTVVLVVVSSALSVGLGAGIKYVGENMNSTSTGNYTYINVQRFRRIRCWAIKIVHLK